MRFAGIGQCGHSWNGIGWHRLAFYLGKCDRCKRNGCNPLDPPLTIVVKVRRAVNTFYSKASCLYMLYTYI